MKKSFTAFGSLPTKLSFSLAFILCLLGAGKAHAQWSAAATNVNAPYQVIHSTKTFFEIDTTGMVSIRAFTGTNPMSTFRLSVNGMVRAREIYVNMDSWADYVFDKEYKLMPLSELEQFIQANKHLPNIPKASEIAEKELPVGDTQRLLMEKIEELTLYIIAQQKQIDELKASQKK